MSKKYFYHFTLILALLGCAINVNANTIYVNSTSGNDTSGDGSMGSPYKTFTKGYALTNSGGTLDLTGTFTWTDADETGDVNTEQTINNGFIIGKNITIRGQGADQTIIQAASSSGTADRRIFAISSNGVTATIKNLELRYGKNTWLGGAMHLSSASSLTIENCYIHHNMGGNSGAIEVGSTFSLTILNSTLANNSGQITGSSGGGIHQQGSGTIIITNSTLCNNSVTANGTAGGIGAGIRIKGVSTVYLTNCTIANNSTTSTLYGCGIAQENGTMYLKNNIIANNGSYSWSDFEHYQGALNDNGYNIIEYYSKGGGATGSLSGNTITGNQANLNLSSSLADNSTAIGTPTLALTFSSSPAVNGGNSSANGAVSVPTTDQRGFSRNSTTDMGAFEYNGFAPASTPTTQATNDGFTSTSSSETTVSWARGNGDYCAVFMAATTSGTASPVDETTYSASTTFGAGDQIGSTGWYCIYNGTNNTTSVTGLTAETTYRVHVCEYNEGAGSELYLTDSGTDNPNNVTTSEASLPVELNTFSAKQSGDIVQLSWRTESETDNLGFIVERSLDNNEWTTVGSYKIDQSLRGQGDKSTATEYSYADSDVEQGLTYTYRLSDVSTDGVVIQIATTTVDVVAVPQTTELFAAYPNPFNPQTTISYQMANEGEVNISVYDMLGRKVSTLVDQTQSAGEYNLSWNAVNDFGDKVPTGVYVIRMQAGSVNSVQKVMLMK